MSFSSETKAELCREKLSHLECVQAEAYGVLLFCNVYTPNEVRITTRSLDFAQRLPKLFHRAFEVTFDQTPEASGRGAFVCSDPGADRPDDGRLRRQRRKPALPPHQLRRPGGTGHQSGLSARRFLGQAGPSQILQKRYHLDLTSFPLLRPPRAASPAARVGFPAQGDQPEVQLRDLLQAERGPLPTCSPPSARPWRLWR